MSGTTARKAAVLCLPVSCPPPSRCPADASRRALFPLARRRHCAILPPCLPVAVARRAGLTQIPGASISAYVYIIGSETQAGWRSYVGWTTDLDRRLAAHNAGTGARSTRGRVWVLLYAERLETRGAALSREWHLKRDRRFRKSVLPPA